MKVVMKMAHQFKIEWAGTPNFRQGRNGKKPIAIVNHITSGNYPGCLSWMQNPKAQASAHYLVTKQGQIFQLVKDEDTSWHAGAVNKPTWPLYNGTNPNYYTIGIEHEGFDGNLTDAQYQATLWLHRHLIQKWNIPVDRDHIIGHYRIDSVNRPNCPGPKFPWDRLFNDLKGGGEDMSKDVPDWKVNIMRDSLAAGLITSPDHNPDEPAPKWFVLAVCLNLLRKVGK